MSSMQIRKLVLYALLVAVGCLIYRNYEVQTAQLSMTQAAQQSENQTHERVNWAAHDEQNASYTPKAFKPMQAGQTVSLDQSHLISPIAPLVANDSNNTQLVFVKTPTLNVDINLKTGSIETLSLPSYPISLSDKNPFVLFTQKEGQSYQSQSGLIDEQSNPLNITYQSDQTTYTMGPNQEQMTIVLNGHTSHGLIVTKTYSFHKDSYVIDVSYQIQNKGIEPLHYSFYGQLTRQPSVSKGLFSTNRGYKGAAISSSSHPYEEITYNWLDTHQMDRQIQGGWVAQQEQYFITAWVPIAHEQNNYYSHTAFQNNSEGKADNVYTVGFTTPMVTLEPGKTNITSARLYAGPEIATVLQTVAPGLDLAVDYGWLWMLSKLIFTIMTYIETVVHNWGFAIILTTLLIKLCFYKLSEHSYKSMAKMKKFAPKIQALKDRFGDDKAQLSKATMELYRKEKVNPAGGCLPMVIQIPFFFALYSVLINSVQLRQAPFIFWVKDLAIYDPYYVLPVLVGFSMFLQQKMSPPPPDPAQAKMMMFLPVMFTVFFARFPAGLTLYWLTNNLLTVLQQWYVMRKFDNPDYVKDQIKKDREKEKKLSKK
jgi:YidC/Oxa1 family membrane protein insertase